MRKNYIDSPLFPILSIGSCILAIFFPVAGFVALACIILILYTQLKEWLQEKREEYLTGLDKMMDEKVLLASKTLVDALRDQSKKIQTLEVTVKNMTGLEKRITAIETKLRHDEMEQKRQSARHAGEDMRGRDAQQTASDVRSIKAEIRDKQRDMQGLKNIVSQLDKKIDRQNRNK